MILSAQCYFFVRSRLVVKYLVSCFNMISYCVRCTVPSGPLSVLANTWGLSEAISNGLARDGGLYVPKHSLPKPTFGQMKRLVPLLYKHKAHIVLEKLIHHSQVIHLWQLCASMCVEFDHELSWMFTKRFIDFYLICRK